MGMLSSSIKIFGTLLCKVVQARVQTFFVTEITQFRFRIIRSPIAVVLVLIIVRIDSLRWVLERELALRR